MWKDISASEIGQEELKCYSSTYASTVQHNKKQQKDLEKALMLFARPFMDLHMKKCECALYNQKFYHMQPTIFTV